jgi:hypothetical protein
LQQEVLQLLGRVVERSSCVGQAGPSHRIVWRLSAFVVVSVYACAHPRDGLHQETDTLGSPGSILGAPVGKTGRAIGTDPHYSTGTATLSLPASCDSCRACFPRLGGNQYSAHLGTLESSILELLGFCSVADRSTGGIIVSFTKNRQTAAGLLGTDPRKWDGHPGGRRRIVHACTTPSWPQGGQTTMCHPKCSDICSHFVLGKKMCCTWRIYVQYTYIYVPKCTCIYSPKSFRWIGSGGVSWNCTVR